MKWEIHDELSGTIELDVMFVDCEGFSFLHRESLSMDD